MVLAPATAGSVRHPGIPSGATGRCTRFHTAPRHCEPRARQLARWRGKKGAAVAVAHSLLTVAYHMLRDGVSYEELGAGYFDRLEPDKLARHHVRRGAELGYDVKLGQRPAA